MNKKVTIVICSYGRKKLLVNTLQSLWEKTPKDTYRLILVDNSFQDMSIKQEILALGHESQRIDSLVFLGKNKGKPYSWNLGYFLSMNLCEIEQEQFPEHFVFCDSDLEFTDNWLETMLDIYTESQGMPLGCLSGYLNICGEFKIKNEPAKRLQLRRHPPGCCWMISRKVFEKVGLFNSDVLIRGVDTEYSRRLWKAGFKNACVLPESLVLHTGEGQRTWDLKTGDSIYHGD